MRESRGPSSGGSLGWIAVLVGIISLALGFVYICKGQEPDGFDGVLFGGLAFAANRPIRTAIARLGHRTASSRHKHPMPRTGHLTIFTFGCAWRN